MSRSKYVGIKHENGAAIFFCLFCKNEVKVTNIIEEGETDLIRVDMCECDESNEALASDPNAKFIKYLESC